MTFKRPSQQENKRTTKMSKQFLAESKKRAVNKRVTEILKNIIKEEYGKLIRENEMSDNVETLTMFADNDHKLYNDLMNNYLKNMLTKKKRGVYDHNLAIKLLEYYYQNYVRPEYKRQFGDDIKLSPAERKQFAEYYVNVLEETDEFQNQETKQIK